METKKFNFLINLDLQIQYFIDVMKL